MLTAALYTVLFAELLLYLCFTKKNPPTSKKKRFFCSFLHVTI